MMDPLAEVPPYLREIARAALVRLNEEDKRVVSVKVRDGRCVLTVDASPPTVEVKYVKREEPAP